MDVRLVVTGHDNNGKAVFASDGLVAPITLAAMPGAEFHRLWGSDGPQTYPDAGAAPNAPGISLRLVASDSACSRFRQSKKRAIPTTWRERWPRSRPSSPG